MILFKESLKQECIYVFSERKVALICVRAALADFETVSVVILHYISRGLWILFCRTVICMFLGYLFWITDEVGYRFCVHLTHFVEYFAMSSTVLCSWFSEQFIR